MKKIKLLIISAFVLSGLIIKFAISTPVVSSQTILSAPTGLNVTDGSYSTKIGIYWDTMRGATNYRIFRSATNNAATATDIGTTQSNSFFDATAAPGQTLFYWVRSENGSTTGELSAAEQGFRAVGTVNPNNPPLNPPPVPPANPLTATKIYLGKALFWDEQLSSTRTVSCGTCHSAGEGGSDKRTIFNSASSDNPGFDSSFGTADDVFGSPGVPLSNADGTYSWSTLFGVRDQVTGRKSNSFINAAYSPSLFWDGRATGTFRDPLTNAVVINNGGALESQAVGPILNSGEMAHVNRNWGDVSARLGQAKPLALSPGMPQALQTWIGGRSYGELFLEAFGTSEITPSRIALAIASYERSLYSDQTPWDVDAGGILPLTPQENRGRQVFVQAQCAACHTGNLFTNNAFFNIGLRPAAEDTGRFQVTGNAANLGEFRAPSLRNVELRAPYMHNGRFATLEDVIEFYNRGGDFPNQPNFPGNLIRPRNLSVQQKADLAAFLRRPLTDARVRNEVAPFDRPTLYTESNRVPQVSGVGRAGAGGLVPQVKAIEPPLVGNPNFTVAVSNSIANAQAVLVIHSSDPGLGQTIPASGSFARIQTQLLNAGSGAGYGSISLAIPDNPALVGQTFFGRWYITDAAAANGFSVSQVFSFTVFGEATQGGNERAFVDFDGDGKTDISVFRPSSGAWYYTKSSDNAVAGMSFGQNGDQITPADFDGDGKTDIAVYRSGVWYLMNSLTGFSAVQFGAAGDLPLPADFDGDGRADINVFRPSSGSWYRLNSSDGVFVSTQFGQNGDVPVLADFDGDNRNDVAVFRAGNWYSLNSSDGQFRALQWGLGTDVPVAADYDGDGRTDVAVFRPSAGAWYVLKSQDGGLFSTQFGISTDVPVTGDYDGDNRADVAVFRAGSWFVNRSTSGLLTASFGNSDDRPAPAAYVP